MLLAPTLVLSSSGGVLSGRARGGYTGVRRRQAKDAGAVTGRGAQERRGAAQGVGGATAPLISLVAIATDCAATARAPLQTTAVLRAPQPPMVSTCV